MAQVLGYTISKIECNVPNHINAKGFYMTREKALKLMNYQAEEYCINKVGLDNFTRGQLENVELRNKIRDGLVLYQEPENEIRIVRRFYSYVAFAGYTEADICRFGILPIIQEKIVVCHTSGEKEIVDSGIDLLPLAHHLEREKDIKIAPLNLTQESLTIEAQELDKKKLIENRIKNVTNLMNMTNYESFRQELFGAIKKRSKIEDSTKLVDEKAGQNNISESVNQNEEDIDIELVTIKEEN